ncbi:MAG: hypothetical protein OXS35_05510, partial [Dehalococcoidia bacterium]|nr:hypothetical protein [Dehalococcoidia bacterium]
MIAAESDYEKWLAERNRRTAHFTRHPDPDPTPTARPRPTPEPDPLLRVVDVADCLNMRALPYIEAEVVECIPLGEYLGDASYALEGKDGVTWRGVYHPINDYREYWADARYLEG